MRKMLIALSALAALGLALPVTSGTAQAEGTKVVIKRDRGHHYGWRNHHHHHKTVIIKRGHPHHTKVVIRRGHRHHD